MTYRVNTYHKDHTQIGLVLPQQVQGDELRVTSKSRDDLQAIIALVKGKDLDFAVQFVNYR